MLYVSSYCYMCPHTAIYVSSYCYICVLIIAICVLILLYVSSYCHICVLILLYMCAGGAYDWYSSNHAFMSQVYICYVCVLILLCMCPHTAIYVSSYCYVLILLYTFSHTIYVSSYSYYYQEAKREAVCHYDRSTLAITPACPRWYAKG